MIYPLFSGHATWREYINFYNTSKYGETLILYKFSHFQKLWI